MTHTSDKLREELEKVAPSFYGVEEGEEGHLKSVFLSGEGIEESKRRIFAFLKTAIKDREGELAEKVRKMLEGSEMQPHFLGGATKFVKKGRREAYETVLRLLHTDTNSENK